MTVDAFSSTEEPYANNLRHPVVSSCRPEAMAFVVSKHGVLLAVS
jgi:hypothetical protein